MNSQGQRVLKAALAALERSTGFHSKLIRKAAGAVVELKTAGRTHRFAVELKTADRFETPAMIKVRDLRGRPLLVAPFITQEVARRCRDLHLPFIDTAGNAYLEAPGLLVYVVGQTRPAELRRDRFRAVNPAGLQISFALLCDPNLIHTNYREIAARAGVALGTVGPVIRDLETRGFLRFTAPNNRKLLDPERMLEEWVIHYPIALRPKLNPRRFGAEFQRLQHINLEAQGAHWGGEAAAAKLTEYLKPEHFTIYAREPVAKLIA